MMAKVLIAAFLTLLATAGPTFAQGNGNGNGNGNANQTSEGSGNGNGNAGGGNAGNNGNGNAGNSNGNAGNGNGETGNAGNSNGNAGNGNNGNATAGADELSAPAEPALVPEEDIQSLVRSGQAVSLVSLLPSLQARTGGQIIDAQLVRTERALIYALKVLTPDGRVGIEYYNARSGTHIEVR